jgi:hypothetical protein
MGGGGGGGGGGSPGHSGGTMFVPTFPSGCTGQFGIAWLVIGNVSVATASAAGMANLMRELRDFKFHSFELCKGLPLALAFLASCDVNFQMDRE